MLEETFPMTAKIQHQDAVSDDASAEYGVGKEDGR